MPAGFELVTAPRAFQFPLDHGPHPAFRHEWWYVTGHLDTPTGEPFGFELTFFRFALKPPGARRRREPPIRVARAPDLHGALRRLRHRRASSSSSPSASRATHSGLAGAQADPFRVSLDDWSLAATADTKHGASSRPTRATRSTWRWIPQRRSCSTATPASAAKPMRRVRRVIYSMPRMSAHGKLTRERQNRRRAAAPSGSIANGAAARWVPISRAGTGSRCSSMTAAR